MPVTAQRKPRILRQTSESRMTKRKENPKRPGAPSKAADVLLRPHSCRFSDPEWKWIQQQGGVDYLRRLVKEDRDRTGTEENGEQS